MFYCFVRVDYKYENMYKECLVIVKICTSYLLIICCCNVDTIIVISVPYQNGADGSV